MGQTNNGLLLCITLEDVVTPFSLTATAQDLEAERTNLVSLPHTLMFRNCA